MSRYVIHMTFSVAPRLGPGARRLTSGWSFLVLHESGGLLAVHGSVSAESPVDAARSATAMLRREWAVRGRGPLTPLSWRADRARAFAGRRDGGSWSASWRGRGPGGDGGGLAGVREPRRPKPGPGSLTAALDPPD